MLKQRTGFTLIELLIVIAIIALVATLATVPFSSARQKSRDSSRVADLRQVRTALELGNSETSGFPTGAYGSAIIGSGTSSVLCNTGGLASWQENTADCGGGTVWMADVPEPAKPPSNGIYRYLGTATSYQIFFSLESGSNQLPAGQNCLNQNGFSAGASAC